MSNSSLVTYTKISPNKTIRNAKISKITYHIIAGDISLVTLGNIFASPERKASSNYGINKQGEIGMYAEEHFRSWCSSSAWNDHRAITIELANSVIGGNWNISDATLESAINLSVDICRRNGMKKLNYDYTKNGSITRHNMFSNTVCPGQYVTSKLKYIEQEVNKRLNSGIVIKPSFEDNSIIKLGSKGDRVKELQIELNYYGWDAGTPDGIAGKQTDKAIRDFQRAHGLGVDGMFGPSSYKVLNAAIDKRTKAKREKEIRLNDKGKKVSDLQRDLLAFGWDVGEADGIAGKKTIEAIKSFQRAHGLGVDGIFGEGSFDILNAAKSERARKEEENNKEEAAKEEDKKENPDEALFKVNLKKGTIKEIK